jgi:predicted unusual protein kinase regulating ubiquinone biosynthesis (AarF/ABC1/UbiB family)
MLARFLPSVHPSMSGSRRSSAVPTTRLGRIVQFGLMSGELAVSTAIGAARQVSRGERPDLAAAALSPGNAQLLAKRLAGLRGPAMKLGQLLSLQGEDLVPEEFRAALMSLRSQGYSMPEAQLRRVLGREYGRGWQAKFREFDFEPVAAASIGQVHRATRRDGRRLALKIQYPGVARSIDSDVDNLASLLRRLDFLPVKLDVAEIVAEAKRQLRVETDYGAEADNLTRFQRLVADMPGVVVPRVDRSLSTRRILAMDWIDGEPLGSMADESVPQSVRDHAAGSLLELMFREFFEFRFMQTDPNVDNYLHLADGNRIALLDFGAVGRYPAAFVEGMRRISRAAIAGDEAGIRAGAFESGYAHPDDPEDVTANSVALIRLACEPISRPGPYDFAGAGLMARARDHGIAAAFGEGLHPPPAATMFLHRKLAGTFLLCAQLRARVDVHAIAERHLRGDP